MAKRKGLKGVIAVRVTEADRRALERLAAQEDRTLSSMLRRLIRQAARKLEDRRDESVQEAH